MITPAPVTANYSFKIEKDGDITNIVYDRAKYEFGMIPAFILPSLFISVPLGAAAQSWSIFIISTIVLSIGTWFAINQLRPKGKFSISEKSFIVGGKEYNRQQIKNFYIKASNGNEELAPMSQPKPFFGMKYHGDGVDKIGHNAASAVSGTVNAVGQVGALAARGTRDIIMKYREKANYKVGFLYGEKEVKLAGGLTENTALVMRDKIIELSTSTA